MDSRYSSNILPRGVKIVNQHVLSEEDDMVTAIIRYQVRMGFDSCGDGSTFLFVLSVGGTLSPLNPTTYEE